MQKNIKRRAAAVIAAFTGAFLLTAVPAQPVLAAESAITFGSSSYSVSNGVELQIGVYIRSDETPGTYNVVLEYDDSRLEYISGAESGGNGKITLSGTATGKEIKYMLNFNAISGGTAGIYVASACVTTQDGTEDMTITEKDKAPVTVKGDDTSGEPDFNLDAQNDYNVATQVPLIGTALGSDNTQYYIVDLSEYIPEGTDFTYTLAEDTYQENKITYLENAQNNMKFLYLMDENENFTLYACTDQGRLYPCTKADDYYYMSAKAIADKPDGLTDELIGSENIYYVMFFDGTGEFVKNQDGDVVSWDTELDKQAADTEKNEKTVKSPSVNWSEITPSSVWQVITDHIEISILIVVVLAVLLKLLVKIIAGAVRKKKARNYLEEHPAGEVFNEELAGKEREERIRRQKAEAEEWAKKSEPAEPEKPEEAEKPAEPEKPEEAEKPAEPEKPEKPEALSETSETVIVEVPVKSEEIVSNETSVKSEEIVSNETSVKAEETVKNEAPVKMETPVLTGLKDSKKAKNALTNLPVKPTKKKKKASAEPPVKKIVKKPIPDESASVNMFVSEADKLFEDTKKAPEETADTGIDEKMFEEKMKEVFAENTQSVRQHDESGEIDLLELEIIEEEK